MLKCVNCDKKADYVAQGNSVCKTHRPVKIPDDYWEKKRAINIPTFHQLPPDSPI